MKPEVLDYLNLDEMHLEINGNGLIDESINKLEIILDLDFVSVNS